MPTIKRIRNKTFGVVTLDFQNGSSIRLPGRNKKRPTQNISRPVTNSELNTLDVQANLRAGDIEILEEEVDA